ncbi:MAG: hypothetical protein JW892_13070 [Anaerolineae bacterium]|nr:hypothetical protein [Anaerolineae bacterium]
MKEPVIFCPQCQTLIWDALACGTCGWRRSYGDLGVGAEVWRTRIPAKIARTSNSMALVAGALVCCDTLGRLWALAPQENESLLWEKPLRILEDATISGLATWNNQLVVTCSERESPIVSRGLKITVLDTTAQRETWSFKVWARRLSSPAMMDDYAFFSAAMDDGAWAFALDLRARRLVWKERIEQWSAQPPLVSHGVIWYGTDAKILKGIALGGPDAGVKTCAIGSPIRSMASGPERELFMVVDAGETLARFAVDAEKMQYYDVPDVRVYTSPPCISAYNVAIGVIAQDRTPRLHLYTLENESLRLAARLPLSKELTLAPVWVEDTLMVQNDAGEILMYRFTERSYAEHVRVSTTFRPCTAPVTAGDVAIFAGRDGELQAYYWRQPRAMARPAAAYEQEGAWEAAGTARALQSRWLEAARDFERANLWQQARQMYQQAACWEGMARMSEVSGDFRRAAQDWGRAGDHLKKAQLLEQLEAWEEAAALWEQLERFEAAAAAYRRAGRMDRVLDVLEKMKDEAAITAIVDALPPDEQKAAWYQRHGEHAKAAELWEHMRAWRQAAQAHVRAGNTIRALHLFQQEGDWSAIVAAAQSVDGALSPGGDEILATALEKLATTEEDFKKALETYQNTTKRYLAEYGDDLDAEKKSHLAKLYEHAAECAEHALEWATLPDLRRCVTRFRSLPRLDIRLLPGASEFIAGGHSQIKMEIHNIGYGTAKNIRLTLSGAMETAAIKPISGLRSAQKMFSDVNVYFPEKREGRSNIGELPVELHLEYSLPDGSPQASTYTMIVKVKARPDGSTTTIYHVAGNVNQAQEIIQGDQYRAGSQHGDRVSIIRETQGVGRQITITDGAVPSQCPNPTCRFDLSGGHDYEFCPACGVRLDS